MGALTKRVLVAIIGIPILLAITFCGWTVPFKAVLVLSFVLALMEYFRLADIHQLKTLRVEGSAVLGLFLLPRIVPSFPPGREDGVFLLGLFILTLSFLLSKRPLEEMVVSVSVTFFGAAYFGILGGYLLLLRELPQGPWLLIWLYVATWAYDTGGYFAGNLWGKHHFAPLASPKKSVEGCVGGFVLVLAGSFLLWIAVPFFAQTFSILDVLMLSLLLSLFGQLGDLVESLIKRSLSAKDSGSLLPGHGGVFDRIDSLLFNAPVLFYYLIFFHK